MARVNTNNRVTLIGVSNMSSQKIEQDRESQLVSFRVPQKVVEALKVRAANNYRNLSQELRRIATEAADTGNTK